MAQMMIYHDGSLRVFNSLTPEKVRDRHVFSPASLIYHESHTINLLRFGKLCLLQPHLTLSLFRRFWKKFLLSRALLRKHPRRLDLMIRHSTSEGFNPVNSPAEINLIDSLTSLFLYLLNSRFSAGKEVLPPAFLGKTPREVDSKCVFFAYSFRNIGADL